MIEAAAAAPSPIALLGGSVGNGELFILFLVILVLFGPRRLPEMARMLGRVMTELRRAANDFRDQIMTLDAEVEEHTDQPPPAATAFPQIPNRVQRSADGGDPAANAESPPAIEPGTELPPLSSPDPAPKAPPAEPEAKAQGGTT